MNLRVASFSPIHHASSKSGQAPNMTMPEAEETKRLSATPEARKRYPDDLNLKAWSALLALPGMHAGGRSWSTAVDKCGYRMLSAGRENKAPC